MAPTFASAAAGNNTSSSRTDSPGDWARRANGATQTFRRPSHAPNLSGSTPGISSREGGASGNTSSPNPGVYVPPHAQSGRNGSSVESRYSRDQLTQLYRAQRDSDEIKDNLRDLYVGSWEPSLPNGSSTATWGRRDDTAGQGQGGVDICWDKEGGIIPLSLTEMTEEEKENFSSSVNSPLKPPVQNTNKDGTPKDGLALRKSSVSHAQTGGYGLSSPTSTRPGNRRRDTSDAFPFQSNTTASPAATSRFIREESNTVTPPPALVRRRTDFKDSSIGNAPEDREKDKSGTEGTGPLGILKRTTTAPFGSGGGSGSPWSATTPGGGFSPMGTFGNFVSPQTEKRPGLGSVRGESRFKGLMSKASAEEISKGAKEKPSLSNLGRNAETDSNKQALSWMEARSNRPTSNDTDPFPDDDLRTGSAALGGGRDASPQRLQGHSFATPQKQDQRGDAGFSAFGMTSDTGGLRDIFNRENYPQQTPQVRGGHAGGAQEPMSPTDTNPYQSPDHDRNHNDDADSEGSDIHHAPNFPGLGSLQLDQTVGGGLHSFGSFGNLGRVSAPFEAAASDRSQTSSTGPTRGFPTLPGLGNLPGLGSTSTWSAQPTIGTPVRDRAFGGGFENVFGSVGEVQSPSLAGLGSASLYGSGTLSGSGTLGRGSKMGSLFPAALQEQMRSTEHQRPSVEEGSAEGDRPPSLTGSLGRNAFGSQGAIPSRDTDSPFRSRGPFDDYPGSLEGGSRNDSIGSGFGQMTSSAPVQPGGLSAAGIGARSSQQPAPGQPPAVNSSASNQPPPPQQRTMVMPDRMLWIYRDPQGNVQGPWSGLEMHDWYKAGFFSPELLVKKYEDPDYEPLAQLIRRIGNSREPFLVPQIGIPHGPPTTQPGSGWGTGLGTASGGAQPPFANSFPSFGTTLTAEQQNALERRKQEEQYLMARQKEHLAAQQQALAKQAQLGMGGHGILPNQLHHHSSAHSLHSQPSFGSITSPGGYQPSPTHGPVPGAPVPGVFDNAFRPAPVPGLGPIGSGMDMLGNIREEDMPGMMERLNLGRAAGQIPYGTAPLPFGQQQPESNPHAQQVAAMLSDRARLQREQADHDALQRAPQNEQQAAQTSADRLQQFHDLRIQTDLDQPSAPISAPPEGVIGKPSGLEQQQKSTEIESEPAKAESQAVASATETVSSKPEPLSLTEQVQKAASAKQSPQPQSPWAKVEAPAIHPFPPPPSQSPLPAPAAQRKQNLADTLAAESRSRSETPSVDTPSASIAPWAKEPAEAPKGPSLKEIQEAEARKAAQQEEMMAAARRAALEREMLAQAQSPAAQPGLPSTSTWASGASPITPSGGNQSAWAKPLAGKGAGQQGATKKTLQQIQKEEEARKQRAAAAAANAANVLGNATQTAPSGKRYADLAGKHTPVQPSSGGGAWLQVGPSGKAKPQSPAAVPTGPSVSRTASGNIASSNVAKPKPTPVRTTTGTQLSGQANALDQFRKWAVGELVSGLNKDISVDDFVSTLLCFPADLQLLTEAVHSASTTIDSRHFAQEFIRRHKLAEKGIVDTSHTSTPREAKASPDGWNTVAKKGAQTAEQQQSSLDSGNFKVLPPKKKGGKR